MENDILKIEVAKQDLKETPEYWASESYETMMDKLQKLIEAKPDIRHLVTLKL